MSNAYLDLLAYFGIGGAHPGGFNLTQSILEDVNIQPIHSVLDIGCGTGQTAAFLANRFNCKVTAIDNHPVMLKKAQERSKNSEASFQVFERDVQNLNFMDNSFDFIISESVIIFTQISKTLNELSRVLNSNGCLIIIEMTAEQNLSEELQRKVCSLYGIHEILSEEEWILRLREVGFSQIEIINTPAELPQSEINDINQSININKDFYDLWEEHNHFIHHYRHLIGYRAFKCQLNEK
ncbi:class I SAM-dependent methyltransferase [Psychrobacillus vulpis]|uniref:Methyltransferase domain-containing protein n=1 Tax=Psychrobacillus vulpis TaxID=2325572 RepID=A0A544TNH1_9BACI|nr:class I SAM-dependent methyltransferase [Psychrobacillus vulpis]TQR19001.1 methyltransferase domain-containing protein [Psychrobacillus vulpis]